MKTNINVHNPEFKIFFKFWLLILGMMLLLVAAFYVVLNQGESIGEYLRSVGMLLFLLPIINAIIGTYTGRKHSFTITAVDNPKIVADWAVDLLQKNGMRIKTEQQHQTILEPTSSYLRLFNNRFGTEQAVVSYTESEVTVVGNFRYIDVVDTKIKFGRVAFQNQPYKHL